MFSLFCFSFFTKLLNSLHLYYRDSLRLSMFCYNKKRNIIKFRLKSPGLFQMKYLFKKMDTKKTIQTPSGFFSFVFGLFFCNIFVTFIKIISAWIFTKNPEAPSENLLFCVSEF